MARRRSADEAKTKFPLNCYWLVKWGGVDSFFMWCTSQKRTLLNCTCVRKSSWNCFIKSSPNLAYWASKFRAISTRLHDVSPIKTTTQAMCKREKKVTWRWPFVFYRYHQSLYRPPLPETGDYLSWFFPLWMPEPACRRCFIQVAKKQQKQWDSQWLPSLPSFFSVKLICSGQN